ncbi:MAG: hypothetical protein KME29_34070 [Calothrix sp. FI2-JRJ7]|nr:hypothetical protein [Calothrix sp. FI2-JRJ7]
MKIIPKVQSAYTAPAELGSGTVVSLNLLSANARLFSKVLKINRAIFAVSLLTPKNKAE